MRALLGVQSYFSLHWGAASPGDWFALARDLGYTHLGIADHAALYALPELAKHAGNSGVAALYGASFPFADHNGVGGVIAFVKSPHGYGNLCQCITAWHGECAKRPAANAGGVPALEAARARTLFRGREGADGLAFITNDVETWQALRAAGAEVYWRIGPTLAAPPRGVDPESALFAPGPVLPDKDAFLTHRLLRAIGAADTLDRIPTADRLGEGKDVSPYLMASPRDVALSPEEYADAFAPFADAIARADRLAERLAEFEPCRNTIYPPVPEDAASAAAGESSLARLRRLAYAGAEQRYGAMDEKIRARLEYELELIGSMGFAEYFLVVQDIVNRLAGGDGRVRRGRSVTCGRGSGAASLVNYCLGVTNVDVLKHDLMFERFLNPARKDPPDIDVDFAWDERDGVLERVFADYGGDRVGRVANHNRYDWRGAFRAAARTLGYPDAEITRRLRTEPDVNAAAFHGRLPARSGAARNADWRAVTELARRLDNLPHGLSMHCGGLVISPGPLARSVPLQTSRKGLPTIQWEKDGAEEMGLVKIDLLGNRSLAVIRDAVREVSRDFGIPEDEVIRGDATEDEATRRLLATGDTFGVFYLESPSMRLLMAKAGVGDFNHAVVHSSIIRPAANAFINEYLRRLHANECKWDHPILEEKRAFEESYGIPVYQEDVVKLAMYLCDYSYERADKLRKCLGKRDAAARLWEERDELMEAGRNNNVDERTLDNFWKALMSMTGYSFCKPHSASFAQVSFEAAYIRAHYPAYFIAAVLSNGGGYYSTQAYVSEAMRMGLGVLGPDVNASCTKWRAEGAAVRVGLLAVSGLSSAAMEAVEAERERRGPYAGVDDFLRRVRIDSDDLRRLALVGALDSLEPGLNRPQLLWLVTEGRSGRDAGEAGRTGSLFQTPAAARGTGAAAAPDLPDYTLARRREAEYAALGFVPGCHPFVLHEEEIAAGLEFYRRRRNPLLIEASRLAEHSGKLVTILAWPVSAKIVETKHGDAMIFQSFEDAGALFEAVVFPEEYKRYRRMLATVQPMWVTGKVEEEFGVCTLRVLAIESVRDRFV